MGKLQYTANPGCCAVRPSQEPPPNIPVTRDQHQRLDCLAGPKGGSAARSGYPAHVLARAPDGSRSKTSGPVCCCRIGLLVR